MPNNLPLRLVSTSTYHYKDQGFLKGNPLWCRGIDTTILISQNKNPDPDDDPDYRTVSIGRIHSYVLPYNVPDNVYAGWGDEIDQDTYEAMLFFIGLRNTIENRGLTVGRAMWIDSIRLREEFRGMDYSLKALALLIAAEQVLTPFLIAAPMDWLPLDDPSKVQPIRKLRKHWARLGFQRAGKGHWMYAPEWVPGGCEFNPFFNEEYDDDHG